MFSPYSDDIWVVHFGRTLADGEPPVPICLVAVGARTGLVLRLGPDDLRRSRTSPIPTGPRTVVAYDAVAVVACFLALGWPPARVLDLHAEFRWLTNGRPVPAGDGLLGALVYFGLSGVGVDEKAGTRSLTALGGPYNPDEVQALLADCERRVRGIQALLAAVVDRLDLARALLRGRYAAAVARMERSGVPINVTAFASLQQHWPSVRRGLVDAARSACTRTSPCCGRPAAP